MASKDIEFKVGIIILFGLIILFGSLYWLQDYKLEQNSLAVKVRFDDVGTLSVGDRVTVNGVRRGKVDNLYLEGNGVIVELLLSRDVVLKQDAEFVIKNLGLMGERYIAIKPGKDTLSLDTTLVFKGNYDTGLPEVMGLLGEMITDLRLLVHSFKQTIGSDSSLKKFDNVVSNLEIVSTSMANYVQRNETKLDKTADNFFKASKELNRFFTANSGKVDSTITRVDRVSVKLEEFVDKLDSISVSLKEFAENINNPEGTMQLLMEDRRLYDDLRKTADNIDDLISDIRANPRKYINLKVEIF